MLEALKARYTLKITQINSKIKQIAENEDRLEKKRAIGFATESAVVEEEASEEDDDCEDD